MDIGSIPKKGIIEPNGPILGNQGYLPAQTIRKAFIELDETPLARSVCLRLLHQMIEKHQDENNFDEHTDVFLLKFLRNRKFDVEDAYKMLQNYYLNRENQPDIFRNLSRTYIKETLDQGIVCVLPQRDAKGRVVIIFNFENWNMSLPLHFENMLRVWVYTLEKLFENEETQINGVVIICDLAQQRLLQSKNLRTAMLTKTIDIFQSNFPFRISGIHLLNPSWHFKLALKLTNVIALLKQKIVQRLHIHDNDLTVFYEEFPANYLPEELGGTCAYDNKLWVSELLRPEPNEYEVRYHTSAYIQSLVPPSHKKAIVPRSRKTRSKRRVTFKIVPGQ